MTPLQASDIGETADPSDAPSAVLHFVGVQTLQHRPDYLRAASARRHGTASFMLQARFRDDDAPHARIGFTASKKIGNAVVRNRAKRRMRAAAHDLLAHLALAGWDYVLVARPKATVTRPFTDLIADLTSALAAVHRTKP